MNTPLKCSSVLEFCCRSREKDLSMTSAATLLLLGEKKEVPMSTIADKMSCSTTNVTGVVDSLETRGLVERKRRPNDRRTIFIALTEQGAKVVEFLLGSPSQKQ